MGLIRLKSRYQFAALLLKGQGENCSLSFPTSRGRQHPLAQTPLQTLLMLISLLRLSSYLPLVRILMITLSHSDNPG